VLDGGPFAIPEHVQNLPMAGLAVPDATTVEEYNAKQPEEQRQWRKEVWGLAWRGNTKFPGLAYCPGGRSLFWGGWSPQLLDGEMPLARWPSSVVSDLKSRYFGEAARQIAVNETNDFIYGDLHTALRKQLFDGISAVPSAVALGSLPDHPAVGTAPTIPQLLQLLGLSTAGTLTLGELRNLLKLEAPLAVEGRAPRAGFFPFNKFSALPLLIKAARSAQAESHNDDVRKRLMLAPNCHVTRLVTVKDGGSWRVTAVETNLGSVPVPPQGKVFIALGTIESTRLALASFRGLGIPNEGLMGRNFMAHLRSNLDIRVPRAALTALPAGAQELQTSALFLKGRITHSDGSQKDLDVWNAMDQAADAVAAIFAGGPGAYETLKKVRDGLGTTHHETGTLWMGYDPTTSVTNPEGRFHHVPNAYVLGPALLPTIGSPNPMLSGIALARRTGDLVLPPPTPAPPEPGFTYLFDGTEKTFKHWHAVGRGSFSLIDGLIVPYPAEDLGLFYYAPHTFGDFVLRLQFRLESLDDNSGVFVRSRDPRLPVPDRNDPSIKHPYANQAWVPVHTGFEVQIDEQARPGGLDKNRTGAIYDMSIGPSVGQQQFHRGPALQQGVWNDYELEVSGDDYTVRLNGQQTATFTNTDSFRGKSPAQDSLYGYIGLQSHTGRVAFRNIRIK
jgi:hypothetical protein